MELAAAVLIRPFLYVLLYVAIVYWVAKLIWILMPPGKIRDFLFRRR